MSSALFGVLPVGQPPLTEPSSQPGATSFLYALPTQKSFSYIVVFTLPGVTIPEDSAAAIYVATAQEVAAATEAGNTPNFKFYGAIGSGKESAMFKVGFGANSGEQAGLVIGVSVEPAASVGPKLQEVAANKPQQPSTAVLAQRIIQNAFNFLAGFSGTAGPGGVEVVPLKAFENWWKKFESRVRSDPSFLEKQAD